MIRLFTAAVAIALLSQSALSQTHDTSFAPFITGPCTVDASILQSDNKLILAGNFIAIGTTRVSGGIVRLNVDGTVDNTFNVGTGYSVDGTSKPRVNALAIQTDGKILVGGRFDKFNGRAANNLVRLNADGSVDTGFAFAADAFDDGIGAIAIQNNGKIVVAGYSFRSTIRGIARLDSNGSVDGSFTPPAIVFSGSLPKLALVIQPDGKILAASVATIGGIAKPSLIRLNAGGTEDVAFTTNLGAGFNGFVSSIALQSDGRIIVGGSFTEVNGTARNRVAKLNTDGTLESNFAPDAGFNSGNSVKCVKVVAGDKILVSGNFQRPQKRLLRLNSNGSIDNSFVTGSGLDSKRGFSDVIYINLQSDNKVIVSGSFELYNESNQFYVARLGETGTHETTYAPNPVGTASIYKTKILADGKILLCGDFLFVNGVYRPGIARLLATGLLDDTFNLSGITFLSGSIKTFGLQASNGRIVIGGNFTYFLNSAFRRGLAKLTSGGAFDNTFSGFTSMEAMFDSGGTYTVEPTAGDKFIIGGEFEKINGVTKSNFAKLNSDGSLDNTFNKAGTDFTNRIINIDTRTSDGKMILTEFGSSSNGGIVPRISLSNVDGSRVSSFDINSKFDGAFIHSAIFLPDGKILIGGDFTRFDGVAAQKMVKVDDAGVRDLSFKTPTDYVSYQVKNLVYSSSISRIFVGKGSLSLRTISTDNNYFDVMQTDGTVIEDNLPITGDVNAIMEVGSSLYLAGGIAKISTTRVASMVKVDLPPPPTGAPTSLAITADATQPRSITLSWTDNSANEAGFEIQRSTATNSSFSAIGSVSANTVTYTDNASLVASTNYHYRVRAVNAVGLTDFSNEVNTNEFAAQPPASPTSLTAAARTQSTVDLTWIDNSTMETGFEIFRSVSDNLNYVKIQTTNAGTTRYTDTGLSAATNYYYKVRAVKLAVGSNFSNEANATTIVSAAGDQWSSVTTTSIPARSSGVAIDINGKAYIGLGRNSGGPLKDWWEFDPTTNAWTKKSDFPGTARFGAVGFVVNGKGYVGTGNDLSGEGIKREFYEYDVATDTWTRKADFPEDFNASGGITSGAAFAIGGYGYVGIGNTGLSNTKAFYRYDPTTNTWEAKANFGGDGRTGAIGFAANGKGYFGFGNGGLGASRKDMWEYNPASDTWVQKADYSGAGRGGAAVASLKGEAYIFAGEEGVDLFTTVRTNLNTKYSPSANSWFQLTAMPMPIRTGAMAFSIGTMAYVYGGVNSTTYYSDLASFTPAAAQTPSTPSSPTAVALSETSIKTTWADESDNETNFVLEILQEGIGSTVAVLPAGTTEYTQTGLAAGTEYSYRVKAVNTFGSSPYATMSKVSTPLQTPTNLNSQINSTSILLSWTDNSFNETGFEIYRSVANNTSYTKLTTTSVDAISFTDSRLLPLTTYYYKIKAINALASSAFSNETSQTIPSQLPLAPSGLTLTVTGRNQIDLEWIDNSSNETAFEIYRSTSDNSNYRLLTTTSADVTIFTDLSVAPITTYHYKVRAINPIGASAYSNEVSITSPNQAPSAPTGFTIRAFTSNQVDLTWVDNSSNETDFEIYQSTPNNTSYKKLIATGPNQTALPITGLTSGTTYFYRVRAVNSVGASEYSKEVSLTTSVDPPTAPTNLVVKSASTNNITLSWKDNSATETGFEIHRSSNANTSYQLLETVTNDVITYSDNTVTPPTTYFYKVRAVNTGGNSAFTSEVSFLITGIEDQLADAVISVFPNPAKNEIAISNKGDLPIEVSIFNSLGQPISQVKVEAKANANLQCAQWPSGIYLLKTILNGSYSMRIVKD